MVVWSDKEGRRGEGDEQDSTQNCNIDFRHEQLECAAKARRGLACTASTCCVVVWVGVVMFACLAVLVYDLPTLKKSVSDL